MANEKRALLQSGMDDYLTKPISERQLAQVVLKWTGLALRNQGQRTPTGTADGPATQLPVLDLEEGLRLAAGKAGSGRRHAGHVAGLAGSRPRGRFVRPAKPTTTAP
jgi:two-component system, NarL family, sensor histidine kinase BarA